MALKLQAKAIATGERGMGPRAGCQGRRRHCVFDLEPCLVYEPVHDRYVRHKGERKTIEVWKFNRQGQMVEADTVLRIQANSPFLLHWTNDDWRRSSDTPSITTAMGLNYADIPVPNGAFSLQFTFLSVDEDRWEGKEYRFKSGHRAQGPVVSEITIVPLWAGC